MRLPILNASRPVVLDDLTMTQEFRNWTLDASLSIPIVGTGSPEGAVDARQYSLYLDSTGLAGSVSYRKMLPDIGGNRLLGWIAT